MDRPLLRLLAWLGADLSALVNVASRDTSRINTVRLAFLVSRRARSFIVSLPRNRCPPRSPVTSPTQSEQARPAAATDTPPTGGLSSGLGGPTLVRAVGLRSPDCHLGRFRVNAALFDMDSRLWRNENSLDLLQLLIGDEVPVSSHHLFGLVTNPRVDEALVDSR